jgi:hypothetical protein
MRDAGRGMRDAGRVRDMFHTAWLVTLYVRQIDIRDETRSSDTHASRIPHPASRVPHPGTGRD